MVAVIIAVLLGVGGQWIGRGGGTAEPGGEEVAEGSAEGAAAYRAPAGLSAPVEPATTRLLQSDNQAGSADRSPAAIDQPTEQRGVSPTPEPPAAAVVEPSTTEDHAPSIDDDRFASLVSLVRSRARSRQFGEAHQVLRQLTALQLAPAQRLQVESLAGELDQEAASTCQQIMAMVSEGRVLAAHALATQALANDAHRFGRELSNAFAAAGIGSRPTAPPSQDRARWPVPAPLARERMVRAVLAGGVIRGVVIDSRSDRVTLRVQGKRGLTFPTVRLTALEPIDALCAEAAELGFAALQAGEPLLARLWLGCAHVRMPASGCDRADRLADLLR